MVSIWWPRNKTIVYWNGRLLKRLRWTHLWIGTPFESIRTDGTDFSGCCVEYIHDGPQYTIAISWSALVSPTVWYLSILFAEKVGTTSHPVGCCAHLCRPIDKIRLSTNYEQCVVGTRCGVLYYYVPLLPALWRIDSSYPICTMNSGRNIRHRWMPRQTVPVGR